MKLLIKSPIIVIIILFLYSCKTKDDKSKSSQKLSSHFSLISKKNYTILTINDPWQNAKEVEYKYVLANKTKKIPFELKSKDRLIKTPVKRVVCLSTTHIGFIDALNEINSIVGVSNSDLINNAEIHKNIGENKIKDIGNDRQLNYELILSLKPDIVFAYGVGPESITYAKKLEELGIPVVFIAEYLESEPLTKTNWLRVFAAFYEKSELADSMLNSIASNYNEIKKKAQNGIKKPTVITGLPWKGVWYVPGGNSYLSHLIKDAGANYLWNQIENTQSVPLAFEEIYQKQQSADYWINPGAANSLDDIIAVDNRIIDFQILRKGRIFNNNLRQNSNGGNDYWESGMVKPDIILNDLSHIFHPELFEKRDLYFYKPLN